MKKNWLSSKTLWTAAAAFLVVLVGEISASPELVDIIKEVVSFGLPFLMVLLRIVTKTGLKP
jgi:hypothetical protein